MQLKHWRVDIQLEDRGSGPRPNDLAKQARLNRASTPCPLTLRGCLGRGHLCPVRGIQSGQDSDGINESGQLLDVDDKILE